MAALAGTLPSPAAFLMTPSFDRPCWLEINLDALRRNFEALRRKLSPNTSVLAVVKANGYGHGLEAATKVAIQSGAAYLGVSSLEEGVALRKGHVRSPVLILGSLYPFHHFSVLFEKNLTPTVASLAAADALQAVAKARRKRLPVHLKIDSGFGRIGVSIGHALDFIRRVREL
jgi:alanine racemase